MLGWVAIVAVFDRLRNFIQLLVVGAHRIPSAVQKCHTLVENCTLLTANASDRGLAVMSLTGNCQTEMRGLGDAKSEDPKIFVKIKSLLDGNEIVETITNCREMKLAAKNVVAYSEEMSDVLKKAIDSLPENMQDEPKILRSILTRNIEDEDEEDTKDILTLLSNVDNDIREIHSSSDQTRVGLDIFTASTIGSKVFETTNSKGKRAADLFLKMKNLSTVLEDLFGSLLTETACCSKIQAAVKSVSALLRSRKLVRVLERAGKAVQQLMEALENLVETASDKMHGFLEQFTAAKKLGKFVHGAKKAVKAGRGAFKAFAKKRGGSGRRSFV